MCEKLTLENIEIYGEGAQVKREILNKYDSLEDFMDKTEISYKITYIKDNIKRKVIEKEAFKRAVALSLCMTLDDLIKEPHEQINYYINSISNNIKQYDLESDIYVLDRIKELIVEYNADQLLHRINWLYSQYYFNNNNTKLATDYAKEAISLVKGNLTHQAKYLSDLGLMYFLNRDIEKARRYYSAANDIVEKYCTIDKKVQFLHYYRSGLLNVSVQEYDDAIKTFEYAYSVAENKYDKGNAYMNIGVAYKRKGLYAEAISYNIKAIGTFDNNDNTSKARIYNNIAQILKECGIYKCALGYALYAFKRHEESNKKDKLICVHTYIEIKTLLNEIDESVYSLIEMIIDTSDAHYNKRYTLEAIQTVIKYAIINRNTDILDRLRNVIIDLIKKQKYSSEFVVELKSLLCDIYIIFEEVKKHEKETNWDIPADLHSLIFYNNSIRWG